MKCYNRAVTDVIASLAVFSTIVLAIDDPLPATRKLMPANAAAYCDGLKGHAMGLCVACYSGVKSETAKTKIAAK
jgi:hypothetical protein